MGRYAERFMRITALMYLVMLVWAIVFKGYVHGWDSLFQSTNRVLSIVPYFHMPDTLMNTAAFIPLGLLAGAIYEKKYIKAAAGCAAVSLIFEIAQYALAYGIADISDLISNTAGAVIGVLIAAAACRLLGQRLYNVLKLVVCVAITAFICYYVFLMVESAAVIANA